MIFLLFILCTIFWQRKQPPTFCPDGGKIIMLAYKTMTAVLACWSIPVVFKHWLNKRIPLVTYLGQQTLGIYVIHMSLIFYIIEITHEWNVSIPLLLNYILITITTLVLAQLVNIILQKNKWTSLFFLGKISK